MHQQMNVLLILVRIPTGYLPRTMIWEEVPLWDEWQWAQPPCRTQVILLLYYYYTPTVVFVVLASHFSVQSTIKSIAYPNLSFSIRTFNHNSYIFLGELSRIDTTLRLPTYDAETNKISWESLFIELEPPTPPPPYIGKSGWCSCICCHLTTRFRF